MKRSELLKARAEAKAANRHIFAEGQLCNNGHAVGRYTFNGRCIECTKARVRKWAEQNKEYVNARWRAQYHKNPIKKKTTNKLWRAVNPIKYLALQDSRRTKNKQATPKWASRSDCKAIYEQARRLSEWIEFDYEVDHIVPLQHPNVCGLHVPWNLQIVPKWINRQKGNRFNAD